MCILTHTHTLYTYKSMLFIYSSNKIWYICKSFILSMYIQLLYIDTTFYLYNYSIQLHIYKMCLMCLYTVKTNIVYWYKMSVFTQVVSIYIQLIPLLNISMYQYKIQNTMNMLFIYRQLITITVYLWKYIYKEKKRIELDFNRSIYN